MGFMPFALSLHSLVSSVGADAGFAAIVGLAILVLLYFAHARETETLREQATVLSERLQQAEAKLAQMRRGQPAAASPGSQAEVVPPPGRPAPATGAGQAGQAPGTPAPAVAGRAIPAAPAGVGAPSLAAATRHVPAAAPAGQPASPASPESAPSPPAATPAPARSPQRPAPAGTPTSQPSPTASPPPPPSH